jgi:hypothetical protein
VNGKIMTCEKGYDGIVYSLTDYQNFKIIHMPSIN